MKKIIIAILLSIPFINFSQAYTSYFIGNTNNITTTTVSGTCLMGGATEDDNAMRWFLQRSGGGDIIVLRATGTNGYNSYLYTTLGVTVNSVETLVIPSIAAANDTYVKTQIRNAEAVFIAGGNQADYINFWKGTAVDSALNYLINIKKVPIGGTSAGMAIMGQAYNSAVNGSVTSAQALANPFSSLITLGNNNFLHNQFLKRTITDTHFDNPDRRGRLVTFLARMSLDSGVPQFAIACDEYTAVCIDENGLAKVFGGFPTYNDNAYFISTNCSVINNFPETCLPNNPLTWMANNDALKVYRIKGTSTANNSFDLKDYFSASGGVWQNWYANNGLLKVDSTNILSPTCNWILAINNDVKNTVVSPQNKNEEINFYPNPFLSQINFKLHKNITQINVYNSLGVLTQKHNYKFQEENTSLNINSSIDKFYVLEIIYRNEKRVYKKIIRL